MTEANLAKLAGEKSFARGAGYFHAGAVDDLVRTGESIHAVVLGSDEYRVLLRSRAGALDWSCTCPLGEERTFCKHAVAAGLAWLAGGGKGEDDLAGMRTHLAAESREALVDIVLEQAANDPDLRARLDGDALRRRPPADMKSLKDAVNRAFALRGFAGYHRMREVVARADGVAHLLRGLLTRRRTAEALELAGYAMKRGIAAYGRSDDSSGRFSDAVHALAALHLEACRAAKPLDEAAARKLFALQLQDDWDFFAFEDYAPLLGKKALARYRALARKAWAKVPTLGPGDKRNYQDGHGIVTRIVEALAKHDGDVDAQVAVKARDLTHPYQYLQIAEILAKANRPADALAWAERGCRDFRHDLDSRLVRFLAGAYQDAGRHDDALTIAWDYFVQDPGLESWKGLESCARRAKAWKTWRARALLHLRAELKNGNRSGKPIHWTAQGRTLLVEILLHERDSDAALAEANAGGCRRDIWLKLAAALEKARPSDAATIYRARIDEVILRGNNQAYDEAAEMAAKIKTLMGRAGEKKAFEAWIGALREKHRAKRNFMGRIDRLSA